MPRRWAVLLVTSLAVFMTFLDVTIVNIAFPDLRVSFPQAPLGHLSWVLNAFTIVFVAALVPAGRLADKLGRRRSFLLGALAFLAASGACGLAGSVDALIAARTVQALGAAILVPASLGLLLPEFPVEKRATVTAIWGATGAVAAAMGPSLGGLLVDWQGWRWVFLVNLVIGLPALVPARRLLRESRDESAVLPDAVGSVVLAAAVAAASLGIIQGPEWGWGSPAVLGAFAVAIVLVPVFLLRSLRHPAPVIELALFRVRSFAVSNLGVFVFAAGFYAQLLANVLFLTGVWGYSILQAGAALTPGPLLAAVAAPVGGRLSDRFGQRVVAVPGGLLFALGAALLAVSTGSGGDYVTQFLPGVLLSGTGVGLCFAAFGSAAVAELPRSRFATGSAVSTASRQLGAVLGTAILVALLAAAGPADALGAHHLVWIFIALTGLVAAVIATGLGRVRAREVAEPTGDAPSATAGVAGGRTRSGEVAS